MNFFRKFFVFVMLTFALGAIFFVPNFINDYTVFAAGKVNINTANATELDAIPEVGPSTAAKIIAYREANGLFAKIEDIMNVSGIKEATFAKMKDFITVDVNSNDDIDTDTTIATTTDSTDTTTSTSTTSINSDSNKNIVYISTHCAQEELSDYEEPTVFEVSAGRERLTYLNSPISFIAKHKLSKDLQSKKCKYVWSFGDGTSLEGEEVEHIYKYAGNYNVVLNGSCSDLHSVSRTEIKIVVPDLVMSEKENGLEIINKGKYEINLSGWKIISQNLSYSFPMDTIISAGKSVTFSSEYLGISVVGGEVTLVDASSKRIAQINSKNLTENISLVDFERFVLEYKKLTQGYVEFVTAPTGPIKTAEVVNSNRGSSIPLTASVASAFIGATNSDIQEYNTEEDSTLADVSKDGFWSKLFHPFKTVQEAFYK